MRKGVRDWLKTVVRRLPVSWQRSLRRTYEIIANPPGTCRGRMRRWISKEYTPHGRSMRWRIFMDIAYFLHVNRPIAGYYFEFGCHEANTIRMAFDAFRYLFDFTYVAFDSFQGLPEIRSEDQQAIWQKGKLKTEEQEFVRLCVHHGIPAEKLKTIAGFYETSLNASTKAVLLPTKAAVIYIDCDLYHSTVPVLEFIVDFLQSGTVIVFDDWNCFVADPDRGERRAWREFRQRHPELNFEELLSTGMQKAFVFARMKGSAASGADQAGRLQSVV